jgi:uncharacterized protein Usg
LFPFLKRIIVEHRAPDTEMLFVVFIHINFIIEIRSPKLSSLLLKWVRTLQGPHQVARGNRLVLVCLILWDYQNYYSFFFGSDTSIH